MTDIRELTAGYVTAFHSRDLQGVASLMAELFTLTDPDVTELAPKEAVLDYIKSLFDRNVGLSFIAHKILVDGDTSAIQFTLILGESVFDGVDVIEWKADKMTSVMAYLTRRG